MADVFGVLEGTSEKGKRAMRHAFDSNRRMMLRASLATVAVPGASALKLECSGIQEKSPVNKERSKDKKIGDKQMQIQYLEIVTKDVDAVCGAYAKMHKVTFSKAVAALGGARTAALPDGGMLGVRAPLRENEEPVVRPYLLVDDIESAVKAAEASGAKIAHPPLNIPGHGTFAIFFLGGIQHGLWQV
jgi:predicted enzyme related to lactoylglutathione lyase